MSSSTTDGTTSGTTSGTTMDTMTVVFLLGFIMFLRELTDIRYTLEGIRAKMGGTGTAAD
jgi:hypothetical protein